MSDKMRVLIACEYSGIVRDAFAAKGHDAWSCDLLDTERPGNHVIGDALEIINDGWDLIIAHPPCTRLCNSGVRWLAERDLWEDMREGAEFFLRFLNADCARVAVENPVMHKYAKAIIGRGHDFSVQPYEHGEPYTKRTCFWTKGLPAINPTHIIPMDQVKAAVHLESPGPDRWKNRSRTYAGIARAMAEAWG
jgi:hypothetical protein